MVEIFTVGGGEYIVNVLNAVAAWTGAGGYKSLIQVALVMGMVFEAMGILVLLVPMFIPALFAAQVDMIWFGILVILVAEIGLLTPPIGMNVFVVKSVLPDVGLGAVFRGVMPYVGALFVALALILLLPPIATALPMLVR